MDEQARAEEHLRVIRSLMERVTVYRAISAPTALVGGLSSALAAWWILEQSGFIGDIIQERPITTRDFISIWFLPLLLTASANTFFLRREAGRAGRPFLSPGLRLALRSLLPALLVGAAVTFIAWRNPSDLDGPLILALTWTSCYGLALLGTANFAPRSLTILGWSFVVTAVFWLLLLSAPTVPYIPLVHGQVGATLIMGLTFGFYHLLYALGTWSSRAAIKSKE